MRVNSTSAVRRRKGVGAKMVTRISDRARDHSSESVFAFVVMRSMSVEAIAVVNEWGSASVNGRQH